MASKVTYCVAIFQKDRSSWIVMHIFSQVYRRFQRDSIRASGFAFSRNSSAARRHFRLNLLAIQLWRSLHKLSPKQYRIPRRASKGKNQGLPRFLDYEHPTWQAVQTRPSTWSRRRTTFATTLNKNNNSSAAGLPMMQHCIPFTFSKESSRVYYNFCLIKNVQLPDKKTLLTTVLKLQPTTIRKINKCYEYQIWWSPGKRNKIKFPALP